MQHNHRRVIHAPLILSLAGIALVSAACASGASSGTAAQPASASATAAAGAAGAAAGAGAGTANQQAGRARPVMPDSIARQNDAWVAQITAQIAGRENLPAEQVFKDIQLLKGQPAGRVLAIMNMGYSRALGVSCTHCHEANAWESNAKEDKKTARGMIRMVNNINEGNRSIPEFAGNNVVINCTTCHQGSVRPIRNLPGPGAPGAAGRAG